MPEEHEQSRDAIERRQRDARRNLLHPASADQPITGVCPCGSGQDRAECCALLMSKPSQPLTGDELAASLMRGERVAAIAPGDRTTSTVYRLGMEDVPRLVAEVRRLTADRDYWIEQADNRVVEREALRAELQARELHHFETEAENERLQAALNFKRGEIADLEETVRDLEERL